MAIQKPFPAFTVVNAETMRVSIALSDGEGVEFHLDQINYPTDLVSMDHPDFEMLYAVLKWLRSRNINLEIGFSDPQILQDYANAWYTPMEISQ